MQRLRDVYKIVFFTTQWHAHCQSAVIVCSDFHCLEAIQGIVERRAGGETGVSWLEALKGDEVWEAMRLGSWQAGGWSTELFDACLCRSLSLLPNGGDNLASNDHPGGPEAARIEARAKKGALPGELQLATRLFIPCMPPATKANSDSFFPGFSRTSETDVNHRFPTIDEMPAIMAASVKGAVIGPIAYRFEYTDGLRGTILLLNGILGDINVAIKMNGVEKPLSTNCYLRPRELCNFFSPLVFHVEQMFKT